MCECKMASFKDLELDWSMLCHDSAGWSEEDLQLAAELGKTLLERNKELETIVKQHQNVIDDQAQEIEYLTKQTAALREVNDSRLRIYEQLEVSIQDLERANHRLILENSAEKKHIKTLNTTIESLEAKCEDLQGVIDELRLQIDVLKRKSQKPNENPNSGSVPNKDVVALDSVSNNRISAPATTKDQVKCESNQNVKSIGPTQINAQESQSIIDVDSNIEQISQLLAQLREVRALCSREERRVAELEEQLATMVQQNQDLENQVVQLHHRNDEVKSMHEELTTLEEVRKGQICGRCLRNVESNGSELPEDDDSSMLEELMSTSQHRSSFSMDVQDKNLEDILQREMSILWISPAANALSVFADLCLYFKDMYLVPLICSPFKIPLIFLHYCLKNKIH